MANSDQPLTPDWQRSKAAIEIHNAQVDFDKQLRRCHEAVEVLMTRTEATYKELKGLKVKLESMKELASVMLAERK